MSDINIEFIDNVWMKVNCNDGIAQELSERFSFTIDGVQFSPKVRRKIWDGKIRLYSTRTKKCYRGLYYDICNYATSQGYTVGGDEPLLTNFSLNECKEFVDSLNMPLTPRWFQYKAFVDCVRNNRLFTLLPTSAGKTPLLYMLTRYYDTKTLILVPRLSLIHQTAAKFEEYGYNKTIHKVFSGQEKTSSDGGNIVISTWQSVYDLPRTYFDQFKVIIGDEGHRFKAKSLRKLMEKTNDIPYRFGMSGTLDGSEVNELVITGLFGRIKNYISTKQLIDEGHASPLLIKCVELKYPEECSKIVSGMTYQQEIEWLYANEARNNFIKNLALSLDGNTLILYNYVDKHGKILYNDLQNKHENVFFVAGEVSGNKREEIRNKIQTLKSSITLASSGTFSEGIDIPNLNNIVFTAPTKAAIRILQSIGRGIRLHDDKSQCVVIDLSDHLTHKNKLNYTAKHYIERMKIYIKEDFETKRYPVEL